MSAILLTRGVGAEMLKEDRDGGAGAVAGIADLSTLALQVALQCEQHGRSNASTLVSLPPHSHDDYCSFQDASVVFQ